MSTSQILAATHAAIDAALRVAGPTMQIGDLISGMVSLVRTSRAVPASGIDHLAARVVIDLVNLVGVRRAHQLIDLVASAGAGADFQ